MISEFEISDFKLLSTGVDGGHTYLSTEIFHLGQKRTLIVYFAERTDEEKVKTLTKMKVKGHFVDEGIQQSLNLNEAYILD